MTTPNVDPKHRLLMAVTFPTARSLITDRNRADINWQVANSYGAIGNKLTFEKTFAIHSYHLMPYIASEPFYGSQYSKWSTTSLYPVAFSRRKACTVQSQLWAGQQHEQVNSIGLALDLFLFSGKEMNCEAMTATV